MNKKEIAEIRKQLLPANCTANRICGCYADAENHIVTTFRESFLSLPEEELAKYSELFRAALSGTLGKNLLNLEFPLEAEEEGGPQEFLLQLRDSALEDDSLLESFYDRVLSSYSPGEHFLILLVHAVYDIPGRGTDDLEQFDSSDEVYPFLLCCVCPVTLAKPALSYDTQEKCFHNRSRDWVAQKPSLGFLFPAYNDRSSDIHSLLYYSKNPKELASDLIESLFGCPLPLTADGQKEAFQTLLEDTLGEDCDYETVRNIHENVHKLLEEQKDNPEPVLLDEAGVKDLFAASGVPEENLSEFDQRFKDTAGENASFHAANVMNTLRFEVRTPDVKIQVSPDRPDLVETRTIDGRACLVIPITDGVEVNGIPVHP